MFPYRWRLTLFSLPKYMSDEMALAEPNFFCASKDEVEEDVTKFSGRRGLLKKINTLLNRECFKYEILSS